MDGVGDIEDTEKMSYGHCVLGNYQKTCNVPNKPREGCATNSKANRMQEVFNRNKIDLVNSNTAKSNEIPNKTVSIDSLALKLANDKSNNSFDNVFMNCETNALHSPQEIGNTTAGESDGNNMQSSDNGDDEDEHNLSTIIREIYERSLKRNKPVDDKIKTLADVVTRHSQSGIEDYNCTNENAQLLYHVDNSSIKAGKDTSDLQPPAPNLDKNKRSVCDNDSYDLQVSGLSNEIQNEAHGYTTEIKTEPVEPDAGQETTEIRSNHTNVNNIIRVPERPGIMEEKYEYFSRNVEIFINRDIPKLSPKATNNDTVGHETTEEKMDAQDNTDNITRIGNEKPFECGICNRSFSQNGHLNRHMRIHTGDKPFQCDVCGKEFSQSGDKRRHERTHTTFRPYQCFICDKEFNQSGHLQRHLRIHAGHILYNKGEFDKELTRKKYTEEKEAAKDKTKKCPLCDKIFIKKYLLDRHVRSHTGETPYKCEECGKGFTRKDRLQTHTRIHTGEKPYCCKQCGKGFNQSSHLKTHIRIHTGDKPYKCGVCGKGFAQSHDRKKHIRVHTGERPYTCPLCEKDFNDNSQLWRHMRTHDDFDQSEGASFKCRICDNEYEYSSQLLQHMKEHADNERENISVPNLVDFQNDSEMEEVRLTAEALVKDTMTGSVNDDINRGTPIADDQEENNDSVSEVDSDIGHIGLKTEKLSDFGDESSETSHSKWDGEMYIAEQISSDSN